MRQSTTINKFKLAAYWHCTLTEYELCSICASPTRDQHLVCVVESPADVWVINQATDYQGMFFVLNGRLSLNFSSNHFAK
jgi:recombinational DNA repair protein RecR